MTNTQPVNISGLAIRILITFVVGLTVIVVCEIAEDQNLINEVQESGIRLATWFVLSVWLAAFSFRANIGRAAVTGVVVFVAANTIGYVLALTEDMRSLDQVAIIGNDGFMHRPAERLVGAVAVGSIIWLFFGLLAMVETAHKDLRQRLADLEQEISDRRSAEHELRVSLSLINAVIEATTDVIFVKDLNGRYILVNSACATAIGRDADDIIGKTDFEVFPEEVANELAARDKKVTAAGIEVVEEETIPQSGVPRVFLSTKAPFRHENGEIRGLVGIARDVTQLRKTQQDLRLTQYAIDRTSDCAYWVRPDGTFHYVNDSACRSLGYSRDELLQMTVHDIDDTITHEQWLKRWQEKRDQGHWQFETVHRRKDGEEFPVEITSNFVVFEGQEFHCSLARDLTELRAAEEAARRHLSDLAHVGRVSSMGEMATGLAHELNQPLGAIVNLAYLQEQAIEKNQPSIGEIRDLSRRISDQAFRASEFIRRMRTLAKPDEANRTNIHPNETFKEVLGLLAGDIRLSRIEVIEKLSEEVPSISADRIQIQQVMVNLLRNAIDSLNESELPRTITVESSLADQDHVTFTVRDNGLGLAENELDRVFEAFHSSKPEGMGMGLAISRTIIEAHGGRIVCGNNRAGDGCFFTVRLPVLHARSSAVD